MQKFLTSLAIAGTLLLPFAACAQVIPIDTTNMTQDQVQYVIGILNQEISLLTQIQALQARLDALSASSTPAATSPATGTQTQQPATGGGAESIACDDTPTITYQAWNNPLAPVRVSEPYTIAVNDSLYFNVFVQSACDSAWTVDANYGGSTFRGNAASTQNDYSTTLPGSFTSSVPTTGSVTFTVHDGRTEGTKVVPVTVQ